MNLLDKIKKRLQGTATIEETNAEQAYDIWALNYDVQPDNLILALDETLFKSLVEKVTIKDKVIADIGCGTGRHWKKIFDKEPQQLYGFDVSAGMLEKLKQKYPQAKVAQLKDNTLPGLQNESCDVIVSTLTMAHIEHLEEALQEWNRVLKPGGTLIITDYHPDNLAKGGQRTFSHDNKTIAVKSHVHPITQVNEYCNRLHLNISEFKEITIDETMKHYYEKQHALHVYEKYKGSVVIYGMLLKKEHAAS